MLVNNRPGWFGSAWAKSVVGQKVFHPLAFLRRKKKGLREK
jgi:hypothetical protein